MYFDAILRDDYWLPVDMRSFAHEIVSRGRDKGAEGGRGGEKGEGGGIWDNLLSGSF